MTFFCTHCGSQDTKEIETGNEGEFLYVAEDMGCSTEVYDGDIIIIKCNACKGITYPSLENKT